MVLYGWFKLWKYPFIIYSDYLLSVPVEFYYKYKKFNLSTLNLLPFMSLFNKFLIMSLPCKFVPSIAVVWSVLVEFISELIAKVTSWFSFPSFILIDLIILFILFSVRSIILFFLLFLIGLIILLNFIAIWGLAVAFVLNVIVKFEEICRSKLLSVFVDFLCFTFVVIFFVFILLFRFG